MNQKSRSRILTVSIMALAASSLFFIPEAQGKRPPANCPGLDPRLAQDDQPYGGYLWLPPYRGLQSDPMYNAAVLGGLADDHGAVLLAEALPGESPFNPDDIELYIYNVGYGLKAVGIAASYDLEEENRVMTVFTNGYFDHFFPKRPGQPNQVLFLLVTHNRSGLPLVFYYIAPDERTPQGPTSGRQPPTSKLDTSFSFAPIRVSTLPSEISRLKSQISKLKFHGYACHATGRPRQDEAPQPSILKRP